jgi:hypothetical protein
MDVLFHDFCAEFPTLYEVGSLHFGPVLYLPASHAFAETVVVSSLQPD